MKILIIGGGIAGLALANLLRDQPATDVQLIEKEKQWQIEGSGLYTPANGVRILEKMGLGDAAKSLGHIISGTTVTRRERKNLSPTGTWKKSGAVKNLVWA